MIRMLLDKITGKTFGVARSPSWPKLRAKLIKDRQCSACHATKRLELHHIIPVHVAPDMELWESNCLVLCRRCHFMLGHVDNWRHWNPKVREIASLVSSNLHPKMGIS